MANWLRRHIGHLGLGVLVLVGVAAGMIAWRYAPSEADGGMPEEQRAFWSWVGTIHQGADAALESGLRLLETYPQVSLLYLRLADVCLDVEAADTCRDALQRIQPPNALTRLYRDAALIRMLAPADSAEAVRRWQQVAESPALDPSLARLVVDLGFTEGQEAWFAEVEQGWAERWDADTTDAGAAFGEGYAAVLRGQWAVAESLLVDVTMLLPNDPQAYRELGRIYLSTGQTDKLEQASEAGIEAAVAQYDLEQELIMRGNLGWFLFTRKDDLKRSEELITTALEKSRLLANEEAEGFNFYRLATIYLRQHRYDEVFPLLDSAEVKSARYVPRLYPSVLLRRAIALKDIFRFSEAETMLEKAIVAAGEQNDGFKLQALRVLAELRFEMGRYAAAREAAFEVLALAQETGRTPSEIISRTILGSVERRFGNLEAATENLEQGIRLAEESKDQLSFREVANELGLTALDLQDANAARIYFQRLLANIEEEGNPIRLAEAYLGLGRTYQHFQNISEALHNYDLALVQLVESEHVGLRAEVLIAKSAALVSSGSFDEAIALLSKAQQAEPSNRALAYEVEVGLGDVYLAQEQYVKALQHFQAAEALEREVPHPSMQWYVLFGKALAHWNLQNVLQAERAFSEAISIVEALRENLNSSTNRSYFVQDKVRVYEHFAVFQEEQGRAEEALYYTERARSRTLVDLLFTTQQEQKIDEARVTDRMIEADRRVRALAEVVSVSPFEEDEDAPAYSATRAAQLRREYERADSVYQQLRVDLTSEKPIYTFNPLPPDSMRAVLVPGEAMVVYDLRTIGPRAREEETAVAFVILPDTILVCTLDARAGSLAEMVRFFRDQIGSTGPGENWEPTARRLFRDLMAPVIDVLPASVTHLHIVPEGILHYLPFGTLQDETGRFLAERYTLSVTPSASILKLSRDRNPRRWRSMLLLGDPDGRLPGSRREVNAIAEAGSSQRRHALVGTDATQANLERSVGEYDILHFATHGRFVARAPWLSHLELYGEDVLSVEEIGRLDLDAYLVTLSACESALAGGLLADVPNGDEWVGLNQAFLAAGTPTVMATLWPIDDRVSSDFMIGFYEALGPEGKAQALAEVQRQFIQNPDTRHPFYWAPFVIMGDPL